MAKQLGYTFNPIEKAEEKRRYRRGDLELMTTHQLREICHREKIIHGILDPLDKDELIHVILRFRGTADEHLITEYIPDGAARLDAMITNATKHFDTAHHLDGSATIVVYEGTATAYFDQITTAYDPRLVDTNALVVSNDQTVCGVFNVRALGRKRDRLYLVRDRSLHCTEATQMKNYSLYCFDRETSSLIKDLYTGEKKRMPDQHLMVYKLPILDFSVREPQPLEIPLAIDFGTTNTAVGAYLDSTYFENTGERPGARGLTQDAVNYALYYDTTTDEHRETVILPSVVAVRSLEGIKPQYAFGYDAVRLANSIYTDESFSVFYDIKRWIADYAKMEELTDREGRHALVPRKEIIKAYFEYVIAQAEDRFKCTIPSIHVSTPIKQKPLFRNLFREILPQYVADMEETLDEGVTVLYNSISERIARGSYQNGVPQRALVIDCGGGTTDLCSCTYTITDKRVAYDIALETTYENGDTNFGGNNLTRRIMQLIKLELAARLGAKVSPEEVVQGLDIDTYRFVDEHGVAAVYANLEAACDVAEQVLPTRFQQFETANRSDYFKVRSNFYFLFQLAEQVKKVFFNRAGVLRVHLGSEDAGPSDAVHIKMDKWKLSILKSGRLESLKTIPSFFLNIYDIELLFRADIYGIIQKFLHPLYENEALYDFTAIKLSGQSCKISLFADAIKEFIPGKVIQFKRVSGSMDEQAKLDMKLSCVDGALQYLKDRKYGFANITVAIGKPALPYEITATNHRGDMVTLIPRLDRNRQKGTISRNMENLTLKLYLNDADAVQRYSYTYQCRGAEFSPVTYEELRQHLPHIQQEETDNIVEGEAKFFVWADTDQWGFFVVPVTRLEGGLRLGKTRLFPFENDTWVLNFFDGSH